MSKKWIMIAAVLTFALTAPATFAASESPDPATATVSESETLVLSAEKLYETFAVQAVTCSSRSAEASMVEVAGFGRSGDCHYGRFCRSNKDCGLTGFCQFTGPGWGACNCF